MISFSEMADSCKQLGETVLSLLQSLSNNSRDLEIVNKVSNQLQSVVSLADTINSTLQGATPENLADLLDSEMSAMDKAIEEAANNIQV